MILDGPSTFYTGSEELYWKRAYNGKRKLVEYGPLCNLHLPTHEREREALLHDIGAGVVAVVGGVEGKMRKCRESR